MTCGVFCFKFPLDRCILSRCSVTNKPLVLTAYSNKQCGPADLIFNFGAAVPTHFTDQGLMCSFTFKSAFTAFEGF